MAIAERFLKMTAYSFLQKMKNKLFYYPLCCLTAMLFCSAHSDPTFSCRELIDKMYANVLQLKGLKYNLKLVERTDKKFNFFGSSVKLNRIPRKLYINANGVEVLWVQGKYNGDALVNPHAFPYINLHLDPQGTLMRQGQHHTINEMGFDYMSKIIVFFASSAGDNFNSIFLPHGDEIINGQDCFRIIINNPNFTFLNYTVQKGEDLVSIARKLNVSEYMILQANRPVVDDYKDLHTGQVIKVPSEYAKYVMIYIDKTNFLPIGVRIFDDQGLFEQYDYHNVQVNPEFKSEEFTKEYKDYKF